MIVTFFSNLVGCLSVFSIIGIRPIINKTRTNHIFLKMMSESEKFYSTFSAYFREKNNLLSIALC